MKLEYKAYNFKYDIDELVVLKCTTKIKKINDALDSELKELDWYILEEEALMAKENDIIFKIIDRYFYHSGIPIYKIEAINSVGLGRAAEFYLEHTKK